MKTARGSYVSCLFLTVPLAVLAAGCQDNAAPSGGATSASVPSASVAAAASAIAPAASAMRRGRARRHAGLAAGIFHAAHDLTLTDAQKDSLEGIETTLKSDDDALRTAMKTFRTDLLAGVKAGKIDAATLATDETAVGKAVADHQDKEASALDALHTLLQPAERATLVAAVRAKQEERDARMAAHMGGEDAGAPAVDRSKKRLDKLTADLALDAGQQKQVAAILGKAGDPPSTAALQARREERKKRTDALLSAFAGDTFDAKKADLTILPGKTPHEPMDHMVAFLTQLLPILHPDQRDKLAASADRPFGVFDGPMEPGSPSVRGPLDDFAFPFVEPSDGPRGEGH